MPTIEVSMKTLEKLSGKKVKEEDLEFVKGEMEELKGSNAKIEMGDTNRPDLWCVEGIARVLRGISGKSKGLPKLDFRTSGKEIIVDSKLHGIRPFISGFIAKNVDVDEELLLDIIQLQDKLSENYGKKRKKISIGIYRYDKIKFPVHYKAVNPEKVRFIPLKSEKPSTLKEILNEHPKGKEYGYIILNHKLYPILLDSAEEVLSFPPIINSNFIGKVETGLQTLFVEVTGDDQKAVLIAANIFAYSLRDRGAKIESVLSAYQWKTPLGKDIPCPYIFNQNLSFRKENIRNTIGIDLSGADVKNLLMKMQYDVSISKNTVNIVVPPYRNDVMHYMDVIEDIAIAYGYGNFKELDITSFTAGKLRHDTFLSDKIRRVMAGLGFQEIMSAILSSKAALCDKMDADFSALEIENVMSENYSCIRNWIIPNLMSCLTKNMHVEFPQKIFELGECVVRDRKSIDGTRTIAKIAGAVSGNGVGYEDISSYTDSLISSLGIKYGIKPSNNPSFIKGRAGEILIEGKVVGIVGEIHPKILNRWSLEKPVSAFELDISPLLKASTSQA
ncbi:MAG: phenylalanine--tRNA ligase subunit beta [Candidatus Aenigmarchaeota archaeon]|nr:phenylalanine--tRNA ligase subunit beta [Candidatus Aenigmarchaeota archaeon]